MIVSAVLFIAEIWLLSGLIFLLHFFSKQYGLLPLILIIGMLTGIMRAYSGIGVYVSLRDNLNLTITGNAIVPIILLTVLLIYLTEGTTAARTTIVGIILLSVISVLVISAYRNHLAMPSGASFGRVDASHPILNPDIRASIASIIAFAVDLLAIIIFYQALRNNMAHLPRWGAASITLLFTLLLNGIVFWTIAATSFQEFRNFLPGQLVGSVISSVIIWIPLTLYLSKLITPQRGFQLGENRPTFDLIFGNYGRMELALEQATAQLKEIQSHYAQLTDNMSEVFWISDPEHAQVYYLSPAFEKVWGLDRALVYQNPDVWFDPIHPDDKPRIFAALTRQSDGSFDEEFRIVQNKCERWIRAQVFPVQDENNSVYRVVGIAHDITDEKTAAVQAFELADARQRVQALREFVSEATHDMKNPLSAINLKLYLLEREGNDQDRQQYMHDIQNMTLVLSQMVDDVLTLSRLESDSLPSTSAVDLKAVLTDIISAQKPHAELKNIEIIPDVKPATLKGRQLELRRAFMNLIDNAIRYNYHSGKIYVTLYQRKDTITVQIEDTGIGIRPNERTKIFERFYRTAQAADLVAEGTGLGLVIVKRVIDRHNGQILVESSPEQGTVFTIVLPRE